MSDEEKSLDETRDKKEETKEEIKQEQKEEKTEEKKEEVKEEKEEKKKEPLENTRDKKPALSGKFKDLIKSIEELSVLELAKLVKELEERFGVSAVSMSAINGTGIPTPQGVGPTPQEEEKAIYTIHLVDAGAQKIAVIKAVREIRQDLGLKEAKDLVDGAPKDVKADVPKADAEDAKKKLEVAGAKVELK